MVTGVQTFALPISPDKFRNSRPVAVSQSLTVLLRNVVVARSLPSGLNTKRVAPKKLLYPVCRTSSGFASLPDWLDCVVLAGPEVWMPTPLSVDGVDEGVCAQTAPETTEIKMIMSVKRGAVRPANVSR